MRTARHTVAFACAATALAAATPAAAQIMDPEFDAQWGLATVNAQYALERGLTGAGIGVVVVDTLYQTTHPEFAGRVGPYMENPNNEAVGRHGTHVAGIIGAARNGEGMEGVAPDVVLSSIALLNSNASSTMTDSQLATAYNGAIDAGLRIFNNSWGWGLSNTTINLYTPLQAEVKVGPLALAAFRNAIESGAVLVWATMNAYQANPDVYAGPALLVSRALPGWIAVTSVDPNLEKSVFANACGVGAYFCMAAPGGNIYSTVPVSAYNYLSGTSMAAPHVTGAVAIAKQMYPNATNAQLANLVLHTATDIGAAGIDDIFGWGLLNIENLVNTIDPGNDPDDGDDNGALFVNAAYARFAAVDTLVSTLWDRSANRILQQGGAAPTMSVGQAMAPQPIPRHGARWPRAR